MIKRNTSTKESKYFWELAIKTAKEVESWDNDRRAGINVSQFKLIQKDD